MQSVAGGIAAAVASSGLFAVGISLQASEAQAQPTEHALRLALLRGLVRRRRWLLGTALTFAGWPLQALALLLAPLSVVQPALVGGLLVLLVTGARVRGEAIGARDAAAVAGIVGGLAVLGAVSPERTSADPIGRAGAAAVAVVALLALTPYVLGRVRALPPSVLAVGAGLGYALSGISTKLAVDALDRGALIVVAAWGLGVVAGELSAVGSEMAALQARSAARVAPLMFVVEIVVPVGLAPLIAGEAWGRGPGGGAVFGAAVVLVVVGAVVLGARGRQPAQA